MAQLLGLPFPGVVLADAAVQNGAKAKSEIATALAGRSRLMNEWTRGVVAEGNEPCAPPSMMGIGPGHSHSGGADGTPIKHTFASWSFGYGPGSVTDVTNGRAPFNGVDAVGESAEVFDGTIYTTFVPMCAPDGAYVQADFSAYVEVDAACSIGVSVFNAGTLCSFVHVFTGAGSANILSSASDRTVLLRPGFSSASDRTVLLRPGFYNAIRVTVRITYTSASANAAILQMALHQRRVDP